MQKVRSAAAKTQCLNNLKQVGIAYNNWMSVNTKAFPAATWVSTLSPYWEGNAQVLVCPSNIPTASSGGGGGGGTGTRITGGTPGASTNQGNPWTPGANIDATETNWLRNGSEGWTGTSPYTTTYTLPSTYTFTQIKIWNYNEAAAAGWNNSIWQTVDVYISSDGGSTWGSKVTATLGGGTGTTTYPCNNIISLSGSGNAIKTYFYNGKNGNGYNGICAIIPYGTLGSSGGGGGSGSGVGGASNYAINKFIGDVRRPLSTSNTIFALDSNASIVDYTGASSGWTFTNDVVNASVRHTGLVNILYCDGHVDSLTPATIDPSAATNLTSMWNVLQ